MDDGTTVPRAIIQDVPVLFPMSSAYANTFPLSRGDTVMLCFSQRGLRRWKAHHAVSPPDTDSFFSERDAFALPGPGPAGAHAPMSGIEVTDNGIDIFFGQTRIELGASGVTVTGDLSVTGDVNVTGNLSVTGTINGTVIP